MKRLVNRLNVLLWTISVMVIMMSCQKNGDSLYLSPNYCEATINGEDYFYQESHDLPMTWGKLPSAEYITGNIYIDGEVVEMPMFSIWIELSPLVERDESDFIIGLWMKDLEYGKPLVGQTYIFPSVNTPFDTDIYRKMWQDDINIAYVAYPRGDGAILESYASGEIRFSNHKKSGCDHDANQCFEADLNLDVAGKFQIVGHLCAKVK